MFVCDGKKKKNETRGKRMQYCLSLKKSIGYLITATWFSSVTGADGEGGGACGWKDECAFQSPMTISSGAV